MSESELTRDEHIGEDESEKNDFEALETQYVQNDDDEKNPQNIVSEKKLADSERERAFVVFKPENENEILRLIKDEILSESEISSLIKFNKKDINIALARSQKLNDAQIEAMLPNAPYLAVRMLIEHQDIAASKDKILAKITAKPELYKELIADFKGGKW
ncbi:MAG: hypothetical protein LUC34_04870 [Campylobacter sp.]|nr:hypothetical protein [Campylobacter sp.]